MKFCPILSFFGALVLVTIFPFSMCMATDSMPMATDAIWELEPVSNLPFSMPMVTGATGEIVPYSGLQSGKGLPKTWSLPKEVLGRIDINNSK